jgi:hypothetical protein
VHASHDPSWQHYTQTVLLFDDGSRIDLRDPVDDAVRRVLAALGLDEPFAVITAANPLGRVVGADANELRNLQLLSVLQSSGWRFQPAAGASPDEAHREPGYAVILPLSDARAVARRFEQSAFFWFDGAAFSIRGALIDTPPVALPHPPDASAVADARGGPSDAH